MIIHGANNIYEGWTGDTGIIRDLYEYNVGEGSYAKMDLALSAGTATFGAVTRVGMSSMTTASNAIERTVFMRSYQLRSTQLMLSIEAVSDMNTIHSELTK